MSFGITVILKMRYIGTDSTGTIKWNRASFARLMRAAGR